MTFPKWKIITLSILALIFVVAVVLFRPVTDGYGESLAAGDATVLTAKADLVDSEASLTDSQVRVYETILTTETGYTILLVCAAIGVLLLLAALAANIVANGVANAVASAKTRRYLTPKGSIAEKHLRERGYTPIYDGDNTTPTSRPKAPKPGGVA